MAGKKCQRCGRGERWQEGKLIDKAIGPDAVARLTLKGPHGTLIAEVCEKCAGRLRKLGWK